MSDAIDAMFAPFRGDPDANSAFLEGWRSRNSERCMAHAKRGNILEQKIQALPGSEALLELWQHLEKGIQLQSDGICLAVAEVLNKQDPVLEDLVRRVEAIELKLLMSRKE